MPATLYNLDAMNLFVGDSDPSNSLLTVITKIKIPDWVEKTKTHSAGGAVTDLEIGTGMYEAPMMSFSCEGINEEVIKHIGQRNKFTARGNIRNIQTGKDELVKIIIEGTLTKAAFSEFSRESGLSSDYEIKQVVSYQMWLNKQELIYFDIFGGPLTFRIDGVQKHLQRARNLGVA